MSVTKYKSTDGKWRYRVRIRRRGYQSVDQTFSTYAEAQGFERAHNRARAEGRVFKSSEAQRRTLRELIERFKTHTLPKKDLSAGSRENLDAYLKYWEDRMGNLYLVQVTGAAIMEQRDNLHASGRSAATCNRYLSALSSVLRASVQYQWIEIHPMRDYGLKLAEGSGRSRILIDDEQARLLDACRHSRNRDLYDIVLLALDTGARQGEILQLRVGDVDFARGRALLRDTKNGEQRTIFFGDIVLNRLRERVKVRDIRDDRIFVGRTKDSITHSFRAACERAGVKDFHFHDLRHVFATVLAESGASMIDMQSILGHRTPAMVKRYTHMRDEHLAQVMARMNRSES